jgi:CBS domain containing-hemolysin-like protein
VGVNIFMIAGSAVATWLFETQWGEGGAVLATVIMTATYVLFSELLPKAIYLQLADRIMPAIAPVLRVAIEVLRLPVDLMVNGFRRILGGGERSPFVSREEIVQLVKDSSRASGLERRERKMLQSVFEFTRTVAREVMIPLADVVAIDDSAPVGLWRRLLHERGHTRIPVYRGRPDRVVGFVNAFDLLYETEPRGSVQEYVRPIPIVPDTKRIDHLLAELQQSRATMAAVVNEFGAVIGIVTIEDIIEEIMGEIVDEHEERLQKIEEIAPGIYLVDARTDIDDLNDELGLTLPKERYDTLGGLLLRRFGRVPSSGEQTSLFGVRFRVEEAHAYGINRVRLEIGERADT